MCASGLPSALPDSRTSALSHFRTFALPVGTALAFPRNSQHSVSSLSGPASRPGALTPTVNVMTIRFRSAAAGISAVAVLALAAPAAAQQLTLQRIFTTGDFSSGAFYPQWSADGRSFVVVEADPQTRASDVWTVGIDDGKRQRRDKRQTQAERGCDSEQLAQDRER